MKGAKCTFGMRPAWRTLNRLGHSEWVTDNVILARKKGMPSLSRTLLPGKAAQYKFAFLLTLMYVE